MNIYASIKVHLHIKPWTHLFVYCIYIYAYTALRLKADIMGWVLGLYHINFKYRMDLSKHYNVILTHQCSRCMYVLSQKHVFMQR